MNTNYLRFLFVILWTSFCAHAVAQHDSIFIQGYINNVVDNDMNIAIEEDMGTVGILKYDVGKNEGSSQDGFLDLIYMQKKSGTHYYKLKINLEENWNLIETHFWAAKGDTVRIEGEGYLSGTWKITVNNPEQQEHNLYQDACKEEIKDYQQALWNYAQYRDWRRYAPEMDEKEWDKTVAHKEQLEKKIDSLKTVWHRKVLEVMKNRPVGNVWVRSFAELAQVEGTPLTSDLIRLYKRNKAELEKRPDAGLLWAMLHDAPKATLGKRCIDRKMYDLEGNFYQLNDFRGKYVLLTFWSRGCSNCIGELPEMAKFHEQHKDKLTMINLTIDTDEAWRTCRVNDKITWLNLSDGRSVYGLAKSYELKSLPMHILISPEGKWVKRWGGAPIFENGELEQFILSF